MWHKLHSNIGVCRFRFVHSLTSMFFMCLFVDDYPIGGEMVPVLGLGLHLTCG